MIKDLLTALVMVSWRKRWQVVGLFVLLTVLAGWFAASHLGMDADQDKLLDKHLPFRQAEQRMDKAFPHAYADLVIVIDGPSPGQAQEAADLLEAKLKERPDIVEAVRQPGGTAFFRQQGLLYLSPEELESMGSRLTQAQPVLGSLARDPSARGLATLLGLFAEGINRQQTTTAEIQPLLGATVSLLESVIANAPPAPLKMESMSQTALPNRAILLAKPVQDFGALTPGEKAANAIRAQAKALGLVAARGFHLSLTGPVALTDDNFASVKAGMGLTGLLSAGAVVVILIMAVRSWSLVGVIMATLVVGLVLTGAFAAATVKTLNPISVAFAVMFIGIAVDFAIQFVVRYLDVKTRAKNAKETIAKTADLMVMPLCLAALAAATGFLSFLPTHYLGVSQLGLVAGGGMIIALAVDLTLLPALLNVVKPRGLAEGKKSSEFVLTADDILAQYPKIIVAVAVILAGVGAYLSPRLVFDTNTLNLQDPHSESVATLFDLARNPDTSPYFIDLLADDEQTADSMIKKLEALDTVDRVVSLKSFIPDHQTEKLAQLSDLNDIYGPVLAAESKQATPDFAQSQAVLHQTVLTLKALASPTAPDIDKTAQLLDQIAGSELLTKRLNQRLNDLITPNMALLSHLLLASSVTPADLPGDLVADWIAADGSRKISVWPKGAMNDPRVMEAFVKSIQSIDPKASGMAVSMVEAGKVIVGSFEQAALLSILSITVLLLVVLRRWLDAVLVIIPLALAGLYTVLGCVLLGLPINFANIIALPLLLGIGVAFNIYFVINWRGGITDHWATATARAVMYSALTTASAFGSLAVSPHVGTASMGLLLFLSVGLTVATTFLVLPAILHLMPKQK